MKPARRFAALAGLLLAGAAGVYFAALDHDGSRRHEFPPAVGPVSAAGRITASQDRGRGRRVVGAMRRADPAELTGSAEVVADWREFAPRTFSIRLGPGRVLPFRLAAVQREQGRTILTARLEKARDEASGLDGAFLVGTAPDADRWEAVVVLPGEEYRVHANRNGMVTEEIPAEGWTCGTIPAQGIGPAGAPALTLAPTGEDSVAAPTAAETPAGTPVSVDVLFLYNPDARAARDGDVGLIEADCSNFIAAGNAILENSRITNFRWHFVAAVAAPAYPTTGVLQNDLDQMTTGALAAFTAEQQATRGADQVVMLVGGWRTDAAGVAWIGGSRNYVSVVYPCLSADGTPASAATSVIVVCHEMGHNFGCRHDRTTEGVRDGDGHYCYGFRFADNFGAYPVADEGTVMSYAGSRIPYFSNPNIVYHGYALGVPEGSPRAAFNAATMMENAARIAATQAGKSPPAITGQPQPLSLYPGQAWSLTVTATGDNLTYQWFKDGVTLGGATGPSYSVSSAAPSDAGSYTVTVANGFGSVTSQPASVAVATAAASPAGGAATSATAAPGGSAGGGAFDGVLAAVLLAVLLGGRRLAGVRGWVNRNRPGN